MGENTTPSYRQSCFWNYLRLGKKEEFFCCCFCFCSWISCFVFVCLSFGVTLRNTALLLHSGRFLKESLLFCQGFLECIDHITDYLSRIFLLLLACLSCGATFFLLVFMTQSANDKTYTLAALLSMSFLIVTPQCTKIAEMYLCREFIFACG